MRRALATLTVLLCTTAFATACGGQDEGDVSTEPTSTVPNSTEATPTDPASTEPSESTETAADVQQIEVTIVGDTVTPNGDRVEVSVGEPVELVIQSDRPGEIHVHSSPEQEFEYQKGTTTLELDPIERPGVVEVESHTLGKTIVQLEAR
jgi:cytoskeletal protein RodZ